MLTLTITTLQGVFTSPGIPDAHGPALRSALDDLQQRIGQYLESPASYAREQALTEAASAVAVVRATVNRAVRDGDPHYGT